MIPATDIYNRKFKNLRVSLLDTCNFECAYCTMGTDEGALDYDHRPQQKADFFIKRISLLQEQLNLENIRLTGGEPLLYRELAGLISEISALGIPKISLTTNGFLLEKQAFVLKEAGLHGVNISLDALDEATFFKMSKRKKANQVLKGIEAAVNAGLEVKLNSVIMKGYNEHEILPLLAYAFSLNVPIRFLEVMAMGHLHQKQENYLFKQEDILQLIREKYKLSRVIREKSATANYWRTESGNIFGIIANESAPFCQDCNRLRMDSKGNIFGCLSSNSPININIDESYDSLEHKLNSAIKQKQVLKFSGSELSMLNIGG